MLSANEFFFEKLDFEKLCKNGTIYLFVEVDRIALFVVLFWENRVLWMGNSWQTIAKVIHNNGQATDLLEVWASKETALITQQSL